MCRATVAAVLKLYVNFTKQYLRNPTSKLNDLIFYLVLRKRNFIVKVQLT
jgi:hypothetical protein